MPDFEFKPNTTVQTKQPKQATARMPQLTSVTQPVKKKAVPADLTPEQKAQQVLMAASNAPTQPQEPVEAQTSTSELDDGKELESKYDSEELARIFDEIIFAGEYSEKVLIKGRLQVVFRTRTSEEIEQMSQILDATQANLIATLNEKRSILNLQYALAWYQSENLAVLKNEERAAFIRRLPGPVVGALLMALSDFDDKVFAACKDADANF